jgi:hypothetical protein
MKAIRAAAAVAAMAAVLAAPAFAQTASTTTTTTVHSATGIPVTSGTGVIVTPGVPTSPQPLVAGAVMSPGSTTQVLGAGPNTRTTITTYWVNVPPNVESDSSFQRWQSLR